MILKAWINGKVYPLVQGATFSDEFNETLDSGSIIISNVSKLDIKPYDDVIVFDSQKIDVKGWSKRYNDLGGKPKFFYKHLLIHQISREETFLGNETGEFDEFGQPIVENIRYEYKIELCSETKKLETIQLPNVSVTQPVKEARRKTVKELALQFLEVYNIKEKIANNDGTYKLVNKYEFDEETLEIFANVYSPEFTLNNPNLRDLISKLFITKDMIPYVENDVIYAMDITKTNGLFNFNSSQYNYVTSSLSGDNYCSNLKRTYSDALAQESTGRSIEYIGFRNSNTPLMTFDNMKLELEFPIYKINKVYMCYYKAASGVFENNTDYLPLMFLYKQDITPLVKLNSERNVLSQDWDDFNENPPQSMEEMAKYKLCTLGYDIGSNSIEGWGSKYSYPRGWWLADKTASYLENIIKAIENFSPLGNLGKKDFQKIDDRIESVITSRQLPLDNIIPAEDTVIDNDVYKMKSIFFIVDYTPFYSGSIIHSKNFGDRNSFITVNDNPSSSLTLLESDGIAQDEKLNRFGNEALVIMSRYKQEIESKDYVYEGEQKTNYLYPLQPLGSIYNRGEDEDVIIYHREFSIHNNEITCTYYGTKDYVLKNYFTSVYARHRTYGLMSYGESIRRSENEKMFLLLSKNRCHYEKNKIFSFESLNRNENELLTSFKDKSLPFDKVDEFANQDKINNALFYYEKNGDGSENDSGYLLKQLNVFTSGRSICFNMTTKDNIASNPYIKQFKPEYNLTDATKDFTGSVQDFDMFTNEYGFTKNINFILGHTNKNVMVNDKIEAFNKAKVQETYKYLLKIPALDKNKVGDYISSFSNKISIKNNKKIHKDNKEIIDMTYQIEAMTDDRNIMFSPWIMKLCDLVGNYQKFEENKKTYLEYSEGSMNCIIAGTEGYIKYNGFENEFLSEKAKGFFFILGIKNTEFTFPEFEEGETGEKERKYFFEGKYTSSVVNKVPTILTEDYIEEVQLNINNVTLKSNKDSNNNNNITNEIIIDLFVDFIYKKNLGSAGLFSTKSLRASNLKLSAKKMENQGWESVQALPGVSDLFYFATGITGSINVKDINTTVEETLDLTKVYVDENSAFNDTNFSFNNLEKGTLLVSDWKERLVEYHKNMFFVKAPSLRRSSVYDEYEVLPFEEDSSINFSNRGNSLLQPVFKYAKIEETPTTDIYNLKYEIYNPNDVPVSLSVYVDYNLVSISVLPAFESISLRDAAFGESVANINATFKHVDYEESITNVYVEGATFDNVLDTNMRSIYITFDKTKYSVGDSIRYYYKNNSEYSKNNDGHYHFVFGVNLTQEDINNGYVRIYLSLINDKDKYIYDDNHNVVGEIYNYVNGEKTYGVDNYYKEN